MELFFLTRYFYVEALILGELTIFREQNVLSPTEFGYKIWEAFYF